MKEAIFNLLRYLFAKKALAAKSMKSPNSVTSAVAEGHYDQTRKDIANVAIQQGYVPEGTDVNDACIEAGNRYIAETEKRKAKKKKKKWLLN